jgi:hypothetical protein
LQEQSLSTFFAVRHLMVAVPLGLSLCLSACVTLDDEKGLFPDAVRTAASNIGGQGYPNLAALPELPKNLPSQAAWDRIEKGLGVDASQFQKQAGALPPTVEEIGDNWAQTAQSVLDSDPRAVPLPAEQTMTPAQYEAWAAAERARLEAEIAALPPL